MRRVYILLSLTFCAFFLSAQEVQIPINNPSFEDIPHKGIEGSVINGWFDCGQLKFKNESPPDIHPINAWRVTTPPSDAYTYLGMVVRDNDSWESISQRLAAPLEAGKCYSFQIDLSRSDLYISGSKTTGELENYIDAAVLRILGGTEMCGNQEMLGESVTVTNSEWRTYEFEFRPQRTVNFFTLEAFYKVPALITYNGHILIDNASIIKEIPCDQEEAKTEQEIVVVTNEAPKKKKARAPKKTSPTPVTESLNVNDIIESPQVVVEETNNADVAPKNVIKELQGRSFRKDQMIRINSIYFETDSILFADRSIEAIDQIYDFMDRNKNLVIEIGGHTNTIPPKSYCDWLSSQRAKAVATYLAKKGISSNRLYYKGYGKRKPIITDEGNDMAARRKNQRVEIKILKTNYSNSDD